MMERYLKSGPTMTDFIAMGGTSGQAEIEKGKRVENAKKAKRAKAKKAVEDFNMAWNQNSSK